MVEGIVGRGEELARIQAFLARSSDGPKVLLLEGEPGIGKSALWRVGVERAQGLGLHVLKARPAEAEQALSFSVLGDLFAEWSDRLDALPPPQRDALRAALLLSTAKGPPPDPRALGVAVSGLLRRLADSGPVLVALDALGREGAARARPGRRTGAAPELAHGDGAGDRGARRGRQVEPRGRAGPLHEPEDRRMEPLQGLPQAPRHLTNGACREAGTAQFRRRRLIPGVSPAGRS